MAKDLQLKRATAARWASVNPILKKGEPGLVFESGKATLWKIGDGVTRWNALPFFGRGFIELPKLSLKSFNFKPETGDYRIRDYLMAKWEGVNEEFMDHNPEVWTFRYNNHRRKRPETGGTIVARSKKWKHEPHLNGVKYPGSKWFTGETQGPNTIIKTVGRKTEFPMNALSGQWFEIEIDAWDYIYNGLDLDVLLSDSSDFSDPMLGVTMTGSRKNIPLRFAIVIDNPVPGADCPKLIGPLSDMVEMKFHRQPAYSGGPLVWKRVTYEPHPLFVKTV